VLKVSRLDDEDCSVRVTIETVVDDETTEKFLVLYRAAFDPLDGLAAARQSLTDDEFRAEMLLPTVLKFIGWDRRERPVAMVVINTDLDTVPWISPSFWRQRYPEQAARSAIYYFGALLVSPDVRGGPWAHRMLSETVRHTARNHAVAAFDCCQHNVDEVQLPRMIAEVARSLSYVDTEQVDAQAYFAYVTHGLRDEIDLRDRPAEVEVTPTHVLSDDAAR
jgi:hypothetical protein